MSFVLQAWFNKYIKFMLGLSQIIQIIFTINTLQTPAVDKKIPVGEILEK